MANDEDRIRVRAYEIWEREGRLHGRDREHWNQAKREIESEGRRDAGGGDVPSARPAAGTSRLEDSLSAGAARGGASGAGAAGMGAGVTPSALRPGGTGSAGRGEASQGGGTGAGSAGAASGSARRPGE